MSAAAAPPCRPSTARRVGVWSAFALLLAGAVYLMATAKTGPVDPTEVRQSRGTAVFNSAMIVFREGLEAILIFAAVTASFRGANAARRRPVTLGAGIAFLAAVATWFVAQAILDVASPLGPRLEAITGFIAIVVLLVVMNWFVHTVYWTGWIAKHHRQRRKLLGRVGFSATAGLVALGFTSVYREGFEVVLFLQNLQLREGTGVVLEGVGFGLLGTAAVGFATFKLHQRLPYRRMLVATGVLLGVVLMVMIGGTALSFVDLGWLPDARTPFTVPEWMGSWFEVYSYWATIGAQLLAGALVIGSYYAAEHIRVRRPRARGEAAAVRAEAPPAAAPDGLRLGEPAAA